MKILKPLSFCLSSFGDLGIAKEGLFASTAWGISDDLFNTVNGSKFGWIAPNGESYTEDKNMFTRPTEEQILQKMTEPVKRKAIEMKLIEI